MRVTAAAQRATRNRILDAGQALLSQSAFEDVTTRQLSSAAGIASGTLFNYFPSKEALAATLLERALSEPTDPDVLRVASHVPCARGDESLAEDLFALTLSTMRAWKPLRRVVGPIVASSLGPYSVHNDESPLARLRLRVMNSVRETIVAHRVPFGDDPISAHLFWTLYLGVLAFWANDETAHQEDTLILVDHSMRLFASSLPEPRGRRVDTQAHKS